MWNAFPRSAGRLAPLIVLLAAAALADAQGGPPFRSDDPETPGNRHIEINLGFIGDRNPAAGAYQVPDFDINYGLGDRLQLKYEIPIAIEETRAQLAAAGTSALPGQVIGGLGESLLGIKWRFYEHHPNDPYLRNCFGTGLLGLFRRPAPSSVEQTAVNFSVSTYPQLYLDNPTRAVPRGLVASGPNLYLPLEINGRFGPVRYNADLGYNFGNHALPQSWNRGLLVGHELSERTEAYIELYDQQDANRIPAGKGSGQFATGTSKQRQTTLGLGGRRALNGSKTLNLLLMAGRSFQAVSPTDGQPVWIAYVGLQVLIGPRDPIDHEQVEQKLPNEGDKP